MDLQNQLSKESEEESSTESIGKQPKTLSENDDNYQDKYSSSEESSYLPQTPKKEE